MISSGPVTASEFATAMARLGPWPADRRVAIAVSGGADSLALALLVRQWARGRSTPLGLIVDHRQRPGSEADAAFARDTLTRFGIPSRTLRLDGLAPGSGLHARARALRYAALAEACRANALVDLLLGHHAEDQAETVVMRGRAGSGPDGRAGMAAVSERDMVRLLRPLLGIAPARLRATLGAASVRWVEDPANGDLRFARARLRREYPSGMPGYGSDQGTGPAASGSHARVDRAAGIARWLARHAVLREEGCVVLPPGPVPAEALSHVVQSVAGRTHPPPARAVARLAADPGPATLHGARLIPAGRLGPGLLVIREAAAMAPPVAARDGAVWDGRYRLRCVAAPPPEGWTFGALGAVPRDPHARRSALPAQARAVMPALIPPGGRGVPLVFGGGAGEFSAIFSPRVPIAPSFFTLDDDDR